VFECEILVQLKDLKCHDKMPHLDSSPKNVVWIKNLENV